MVKRSSLGVGTRKTFQGKIAPRDRHAGIAWHRASALVFFHPDCDRRPRHSTWSADPRNRRSAALAGSALGTLVLAPYRRWGVPPRPEEVTAGRWQNRPSPVKTGYYWAFGRRGTTHLAVKICSSSPFWL